MKLDASSKFVNFPQQHHRELELKQGQFVSGANQLNRSPIQRNAPRRLPGIEHSRIKSESTSALPE